MLWSAYQPYDMWLVFTIIGLASMVAIFVYDRITRAAQRDPQHPFNTQGHRWVQGMLAVLAVAFVAGTVLRPSIAVGAWAALFTLMLVASFVTRHEEELTSNE